MWLNINKIWKTAIIFEFFHSRAKNGKECETLWQSKDFLPSSSDLDSIPSPQINFEEKLEEANSLIEKVRKALREIGKGINKLPDQSKIQEETSPKCEPAKITEKSVVKQQDGEKKEVKPQKSKPKKEVKEEAVKQQSDEKKEKAKPPKNKPKSKPKEEVKRETAKPPEVKPADETGKLRARVSTYKEDFIPKSISDTELLAQNEDSASLKGLSGDLEDEVESGNLQMLQDKLHTISEKSESDISADKGVKNKEESFPAGWCKMIGTRMERGSSPINILEFATPSNEKSVPTEHFQETFKTGVTNSKETIPALTDVTQPKEGTVIPQEEAILASTRDVPKASNADDDGGRLSLSSNEFEEFSDSSKSRNRTVSAEEISRKSSEKSARLSIQVMPQVNIRGALVMQRTLNLCIKPTGSIINDMTVKKPNVDYVEINVAPDDGNNIKFTHRQCPEDCKDPDGGYCKADGGEEVTNVKGLTQHLIDPTGSSEHFGVPTGYKQIIPNSKNLDEDAIYLYRSFQIIDGQDPYPFKGGQHVEGRLSQSQSLVPEVGSELPTSKRTPWEIGFYKTRATQCDLNSNSLVSLPTNRQEITGVLMQAAEKLSKDTLTEKIEETDSKDIQRSSSSDNMPKSSSTYSPETSLRSSTEETSPKSSVYSSKLTASTVSKLSSDRKSDLTSDDTSARSSVEEPKETPVKEVRKSHQISMSDIFGILNESKTKSDIPSDELSKSGDEKPSRSSVTVKQASKSSLVPESPSGKIKDEKKLTGEGSTEKKEEEPNKISSKSVPELSSTTSSSSYSSFNVHGSLSPSSVKKTAEPDITMNKEEQQTGVKRPHPDEPKKAENPPKKPPAEKKPFLIHKPDWMRSLGKKNPPDKNNEQKEEVKEPDHEVEVEHEVSKESSTLDGPPTPKLDFSIQVSLSPSESSTSSDNTFAQTDETNTIKYFIKGLTGTSQDELAKLQSSASIPKNDLPNYSRTVLRTLQERNSIFRASPAERSAMEMTNEEIVGTLDYTKKNPVASMQKDPSIETQLSEETKMKRLREFQRMAAQGMQGSPQDAGDEKEKQKTVMRITEERGDAGEGDDQCSSYSRRQLPFYRRVLGKIVDPNNKKQKQKSHSDASAIDESISEGEIKLRSAASIGEVHPSKYLNDRRKVGKGAMKYLKNRPEDFARKEFGDKSMRIARQRTQYNTWLTYYLQKHQNLSLIDDSSSSSPVGSSKK